MNVIYLLGAGRSGTTLMATVLNSHQKIKTIGEMHQFIEHVNNGKSCSCGESLNNCTYWSSILRELKFEEQDLEQIQNEQDQKESHKNILKLLFKKSPDKAYLKIQNHIFNTIHKQYPDQTILDSSKYISRYLLLKQSKVLNLKGIYVVRDVRGVINSFQKQVQTPKSPLATIAYYSLINLCGQLVCWIDKDILKIKYEDFVENPEYVTNKIYSHIFEKENQIGLPENYIMPHIIGGNRMKSNKKITINSDVKWKEKISRPKQIMYYLLSFPFMALNRYKL